MDDIRYPHRNARRSRARRNPTIYRLNQASPCMDLAADIRRHPAPDAVIERPATGADPGENHEPGVTQQSALGEGPQLENIRRPVAPRKRTKFIASPDGR